MPDRSERMGGEAFSDEWPWVVIGFSALFIKRYRPRETRGGCAVSLLEACFGVSSKGMQNLQGDLISFS